MCLVQWVLQKVPGSKPSPKGAALGPHMHTAVRVTCRVTAARPCPITMQQGQRGTHLTGRMCTGWERCTRGRGDTGGCRGREPGAGGWLRACWPFCRRGTVSECMLQAEYRPSREAFMSFTSASRSTSSSAGDRARVERGVSGERAPLGVGAQTDYSS